ncbi:MAG: AraC family transcriptional regulator [Gemmobacter sp.]
MGCLSINLPERATESPVLRRDRLSARLRAVRPVATACAPDDPLAVLVVTQASLVLRLGAPMPPEPGAVLAARLEGAMPMAQVLQGAPGRVEIAQDGCAGFAGVCALMRAEAGADRCGARLATARLFEAALVLALRRVIDLAPQETGLLAGLSHPRLHRALGAIHEQPERPWTIEALSAEAGMSRSRFMAAFARVVRTSPMAYVTRWRMGLARAALADGRQVRDVARRSGQDSADGFRRAMRRHIGPEVTPGISRVCPTCPSG